MQTLTEIVVAVVLHSSSVAYSHFGVSLETPRPTEQASAPDHTSSAERTVSRTERVVARTDRTVTRTARTVSQATPAIPQVRIPSGAEKVSDCPTARAHVVKA